MKLLAGLLFNTLFGAACSCFPVSLSEHEVVHTFINGTLSQQEQKHVAAFNKCSGTMNTPFVYTGCREGFSARVQSIHDNIDEARIRQTNVINDAFDPFRPAIPCICSNPNQGGGK